MTNNKTTEITADSSDSGTTKVLSKTGMLIDGIAASQAIDSSGEILDIEGCDISTLDTEGVVNWEHRGEDANGHSSQDIVGKVVFAKKIFKRDDCKTDRQRKYWDLYEVSYIYIIARLYDAAGHAGAQGMAAQIRDHLANGEQPLVRFSIEGTTLKTSEDKKVLKESIARRVAATIKPCNRSAISGVLADPNAPEGFSKDPEGVLGALKVAKTENEHPRYRSLGGSVGVIGNPFLEAADIEQAESLLKGWPKDDKENLENAKGFLNEPAAQDNILEQGNNSFEEVVPDKTLGSASGKFAYGHREGEPFNQLKHNQALDQTVHLLEQNGDYDANWMRYGEWDTQHKNSWLWLHDVKHTNAFWDGIDKLSTLNANSQLFAAGNPINKALTAGSYNGAPGSLVGGAALQVEDENLRKRRFAVAKAALRDYDHVKHGDFKTYLKAEMPEASNEFIDVFTDAVDKFKVNKKSEFLGKSEQQRLVTKLETLNIELRKTVRSARERFANKQTSIKWQGNTIRPGKARHAPTGDDSEGFNDYAVIGWDNNNHHLVDSDKFESGNWTASDIKKVPFTDPGMYIHIPATVINSANVTDSQLHGNYPQFNRNQKQKDLIHGINLSSARNSDENSGASFETNYWADHPSGNEVFMKGLNDRHEAETMGTEITRAFPNSKREVLFHNVANDFFGLGEHVPTTSLMQHPRSGGLYSVINGVPGFNHAEASYGKGGELTSENEDDYERLFNIQENTGKLDKMALMDLVMGNKDRHLGNWGFGTDNQMHLIDNGLILDPSFKSYFDNRNNISYPSYLRMFNDSKDQAMGRTYGTSLKEPIHPEALKWLNTLDGNKLNQYLTEHGVPPNMIAGALFRLNKAKQIANSNGNRLNVLSMGDR